MAENLDFHFEGLLSDKHHMDFYEAGRFQYGASRLMVKLDQYRRTGRFNKQVTNKNNTKILLSTHEDGSFLISTLAPLFTTIAPIFIETPISLMWSYIIDRLVKPTDQEAILAALINNQELNHTFQNQIAQTGEQNSRTLDLLENRIARGDELTDENNQLRDRLAAERERAAYLEGQANQLAKISDEDDAKLTAMAAPLLKDMGIALRNSASTLKISTGQGENRRTLLFMNKSMAQNIETTRIDLESTVILADIVQYNVETGWGKLRLAEIAGLVSFNVRPDRKAELQLNMTLAMNEEQTYIECLFARSVSGIIQRAIILSILDLDEIEGAV